MLRDAIPSRAPRSCVFPRHLILLALLCSGLPAGPIVAQSAGQSETDPLPERDSTMLDAAQIGTMLVGSLMMDQAARSRLSAHDITATHRLSDVGNFLGRGDKIALLLAATYGGSRVAGLEAAYRPVGTTLAALMAAGAANGTLKFVVGRGRPRSDRSESGFQPFATDDGWQSFPSGHAVTAFALATAIAEQADRPWVTGLSYGSAALVGWSRIHEDRHWASDVVGGALLGTVAARLTVRSLEQRNPRPTFRQARLLDNPLAGARVYPSPNGLLVVIPTR
jgi:membrane-associated phospholipid phosphatase